MAKITGKGSFAGVPFLIEENQSIGGGRRLVKHDFPLKDEGLTEDLGKRTRSYNVACLVIGDDHTKQAEKLIAALEKGKGTLKHPYFKTLEVLVEDFTANYSTSHQRVTRFDITFTPDLEAKAPNKKKNTLFAALDKHNDAINALSDEFAKQLDEVMEFMELLSDNPLTQLVDSALDFVENVFDGIGTVMSSVGDLKNQALGFKNRLTNLMKQPSILAKTLMGLFKFSGFGGVKNAGKTHRTFAPMTAIKQQQILHHLLRDRLDYATSGKTEINNALFEQVINAKKANLPAADILKRYGAGLGQAELGNALLDKMQFDFARLIQATLVTELAKVAVESLTQSLESDEPSLAKSDVERLIVELDEQFEEVILANADAENWQSYTALDALRLAVIEDLRTRGEQLAKTKSVQLTDTFPALVVQQQHSGSAENWLQLVERNHITHPLFCGGGNHIEVLQ